MTTASEVISACSRQLRVASDILRSTYTGEDYVMIVMHESSREFESVSKGLGIMGLDVNHVSSAVVYPCERVLSLSVIKERYHGIAYELLRQRLPNGQHWLVILFEDVCEVICRDTPETSSGG